MSAALGVLPGGLATLGQTTQAGFKGVCDLGCCAASSPFGSTAGGLLSIATGMGKDKQKGGGGAGAGGPGAGHGGNKDGKPRKKAKPVKSDAKGGASSGGIGATGGAESEQITGEKWLVPLHSTVCMCRTPLPPLKSRPQSTSTSQVRGSRGGGDKGKQEEEAQESVGGGGHQVLGASRRPLPEHGPLASAHFLDATTASLPLATSVNVKLQSKNDTPPGRSRPTHGTTRRAQTSGG